MLVMGRWARTAQKARGPAGPASVARPDASSRTSRPGAWAGLLLAAAVAVGPAAARDTRRAVEPPVVALSQLPAEATEVHRSILAGGPFRHDRDGTVFFNRERKLPAGERGWYREYTVPTPGARHRGARRIVCGGRVPTAPQACWYTADHYASFSRIHP